MQQDGFKRPKISGDYGTTLGLFDHLARDLLRRLGAQLLIPFLDLFGIHWQNC